MFFPRHFGSCFGSLAATYSRKATLTVATGFLAPTLIRANSFALSRICISSSSKVRTIRVLLMSSQDTIEFCCRQVRILLTSACLCARLPFMPEKKLLIISDAPSSNSGLGRICRDLSTRIHANLSDVFDLATAGYGHPGSSKLPWPQFNLEGMQEWILPTLPYIVDDFAGKERCICLFIWDSHRVSWFSQPQRLGGENLAKFPGLKEWLLNANIEKWLYCPIDSSGPNDRLSYPIGLTLMGFDRVLAYGQFGEDVIRRTISDEQADKRHLTHLPHGIDSSVFYEQDRKLSRRL